LIAARLVGEEGKVYAFEPEPYNFNLLLKNIEVNRYKNIVPVRKAVSDKIGINKLFLSTEDLSVHTFYNLSGNTKSIEVETINLDKPATSPNAWH
jgi:FkbM family methyltransferase